MGELPRKRAPGAAGRQHPQQVLVAGEGLMGEDLGLFHQDGVSVWTVVHGYGLV